LVTVGVGVLVGVLVIVGVKVGVGVNKIWLGLKLKVLQIGFEDVSHMFDNELLLLNTKLYVGIPLEFVEDVHN